jgi:DNA-binding HxlR family transcriptional regulator
MGVLASADGPVQFNDLLSALDLSKGNLSSHIKKLEDENLVIVKKEFVERKPRTTYMCTEKGRAALNEYLQQVQSLLQATNQSKGEQS